MKSNYKLSNYAIISNAVNGQEDRVVFSGRKAKAYIVSKTSLDYINNGRFLEIPKEKFNKLVEGQVLVPEEEDELFAVVSDNKQASARESGILYEVLQPSANCQLGCYYCGQQHVKADMGEALIEKIYHRIEQKLLKGNYKGLFVGWFGAEPLMGLKQIRELTKRLKGFCSDNGLSYNAKMVTNGLSLKEDIFVEAVTELSINQFEITLDGVAAQHDKHRYVKGGGKSFDLIFNNLKKITSREDFFDFKARIGIRCNVDESNEEGVSQLIDLLVKEGMHKKLAYFYPIKIYDWGGNDASSKTSSKEQFTKDEMLWKLEMLDRGFPNPLRNLPGRKKVVCFAVQKNAELIDAYGNVFNCSEVSYSKHYEKSHHVLGNINVDGEHATYDNPPLSEWNDTLLKGTFPCSTCRILPICGGRCPKSWNENEKACPTMKYNLKERLEMYYIHNYKGYTDEEREKAIENFKEKVSKKSFEMIPHIDEPIAEIKS
ncbi:radical SAM/SPASM domain-containing protein [Ascidiimonas sp. W6]|uniref:radical SAM/SPASM domain-containing protein n=1 Tax=Ascidiimonas meishanensis TaxID=3128903 RepID=UPI0030EB2F26